MNSDTLVNLQVGLAPYEQLNQIVEHSLCIGCGICESMAGVDTVQMQLVENGAERPIANKGLSQQTMNEITSVCPGTKIEGLPAKLISDDSKLDSVWGVWQDLYLCHAARPSVRHLSSTGGVLTGIALYLIESATVDFVLHAKASIENPAFGEACISRTREDVLNAAGSRYGPTATLKDIVSVLDHAEQNHHTFAFIGTPCDVSALRNYAKLDSRVDELCIAMMTMVCGGFMAPSGLKSFLQTENIDLDKVTSLRYRGYGCPGPTTIQTIDGITHQFTYLDFWGEDDSAWQLPPRCKICADGIGDAADIAASDTWDGGSPTVEQQENDLGTNAAIVRTAMGRKIMDDAIEAAYLVRGSNLTPDDMNRFQPHQEAKKRSVWARFKGIHEANQMVPDTNNLRIRQLHEENTTEQNQTQQSGTQQRVLAGKFSEPTPKSIKT
jgi:coenzyme F420 hydrogenase subunit beta